MPNDRDKEYDMLTDQLFAVIHAFDTPSWVRLAALGMVMDFIRADINYAWMKEKHIKEIGDA